MLDHVTGSSCSFLPTLLQKQLRHERHNLKHLFFYLLFQAAFVLPVMTGMINNGLKGSQLSEVQAPQALVVAPTRELANQIYLEARKFALGTMLRACVCYGGVSVGHQLRQIENGCHLLVATPGRLLDFIGRGKVSAIN